MYCGMPRKPALPNPMGLVYADVEVHREGGAPSTVRFLVDSGATFSVLPWPVWHALGLKPLPSEANFVYFDAGRDGRAVFEALLREGVIVRHIEGNFIRVTIGLPEENRQFLQGLKTVLGR